MPPKPVADVVLRNITVTHIGVRKPLYILFLRPLNGIIGDGMIVGRVSACMNEWMVAREKKPREINYATHKIYHNDK